MKFLVVILAFVTCAFADVNNQADSILLPFITESQGWHDTFVPYARWVLLTLATMDLVLEFGPMAMSGQLEFGSIMVALVRKIMTIGFFLMLFEHGDWLGTIPDSFAQLGNTASGQAISPDNIMNTGMQIVKLLWDHISLTDISGSILLIFAGAIMLIAFALMAAQLFMTYVKTYAIMAISPLIFSLGGLSHTRSYAANPIIALIKAGLELLLLELFMGFAVTKLTEYAANVDILTDSIISMVGTSILLASVVHMIPGMVESVMSGSLGSNSTAGFGTAASVAGGMAAGAMGAAKSGGGAIAAIKEATSMASSQGATGMGRVSQTMKNLGSAAVDDIKRSMAGENHGGSMGGRMAFKNSAGESLSTMKNANSAVNKTAKQNDEQGQQVAWADSKE